MSGKDRQRLKRKRKQQEFRRRQSISPYRLATRTSGEFTCYCTQDWRDQGIASILVTKTLAGGGRVLGAYLVDFWCCGLKDAWGRLDIATEEVEQALDRSERNGAAMREVGLDLVRQMVAGAICFARQNGFRLPHKFERWAGLIGVDAEADNADLSLFGYHERGKNLCYVGRMADLRKRLVRSTTEEFLTRPDVDFILDDGHPFGNSEGGAEDQDQVEADGSVEPEDEDAAAALQDLRDLMHKNLLEKVRQWCFANQTAPHPLLPEAIDAMLESLMQVQGPADMDPDDPEIVDQADHLLENAVQMYGPARQAELSLALTQLSDWMKTFKSPEELFGVMGLPDVRE